MPDDVTELSQLPKSPPNQFSRLEAEELLRPTACQYVHAELCKKTPLSPGIKCTPLPPPLSHRLSLSEHSLPNLSVSLYHIHLLPHTMVFFKTVFIVSLAVLALAAPTPVQPPQIGVPPQIDAVSPADVDALVNGIIGGVGTVGGVAPNLPPANGLKGRETPPPLPAPPLPVADDIVGGLPVVGGGGLPVIGNVVSGLPVIGGGGLPVIGGGGLPVIGGNGLPVVGGL